MTDLGPSRAHARARRKKPAPPITRAYMEVFEAMLFGFHNSKSGLCFPSYEAIAFATSNPKTCKPAR
jgi:hypothetical protein